MDPVVLIVVLIVVVIVLMVLFSAIRVVQQYERGVIFVLGRLTGAKGPGIFLVPPFITRMIKVDLRIVTLTVPPQEVITRDNVTVRVTAVVYFYVVNPEHAGVNVTAVEVKDIELPSTMQRAMAKQAEAEREKRAKIIHAEGELQASAQLAQAASVIGSQPATLQLRYLQTLTEIAVEKNSTIIFPLPLDLLAPLIQIMQRQASEPVHEPLNEPSLPR